MLEIHEINTIKEFFELRSSWNEVLKRSKNKSAFFLTWEHILISVKNLRRNQLLRILYITNVDEIIAIAPLKQTYHSFRGLFSYSIIETLDYGIATDYTGLILAEQKLECLQAFLKYLYCQDGWDFINFNDIRGSSIMFKLLTNKRDLFPKFELEVSARCPYIEIPNSIEKYMKSLSRNFRRNLKRCLRSLEKAHGKVELVEYFELGSLGETMEIFFKLHKKRWNLKGGSGVATLQKLRSVFMDRAELFAEKSWFGLFFLTVNGKPIAAKYTIKYGQKIYGCLSGFDPAYSCYSVGNLALLKLIEKCIEQEINEYDFMKGDESHKFNWTDRYRENANIKFINRRIRSQLFARCLKIKKALDFFFR